MRCSASAPVLTWRGWLLLLPPWATPQTPSRCQHTTFLLPVPRPAPSPPSCLSTLTLTTCLAVNTLLASRSTSHPDKCMSNPAPHTPLPHHPPPPSTSMQSLQLTPLTPPWSPVPHTTQLIELHSPRWAAGHSSRSSSSSTQQSQCLALRQVLPCSMVMSKPSAVLLCHTLRLLPWHHPQPPLSLLLTQHHKLSQRLS